MNTAPLGTVVRRLRHLADAAVEPSDRQLLAEFAARRDSVAFAAIVQRHGPMVLGVLRRALRHEQDAEDAFQATFLVLARSAGSIRDVEALPSWLHGVSRRIAMKAKRSAARRRNHEGQAIPAANSAPADELAWREVQAVLDEEVARLPVMFRTPFILCCLEGLGRTEAAARLKLKEGTLSSRLAKARDVLRERLDKRGVALSAVLASVALGSEAAVAAPLAETTLRTLVGKASVSVLALARGLTSPIVYTRLKIVGSLFLVLGLCISGVAVLSADAPARAAGEQPALLGADPPAKPEKVVDEKLADFNIAGKLTGPDGKAVAGAKVVFWSIEWQWKAEAKVETKSAADGSFSLRIPGNLAAAEAKVVATAKGFAPDWIDLRGPAKEDIALTLAKDDLPVTGRITDLEGKPISGAKINVTELERPRSGNFDAFVEAWKNAPPRGAPALPPTSWLPMAAFDSPTTATTDKEGRFSLSGFGRERLVRVSLRAEGAERMLIMALTRPIDEKLIKKARIHGANFEIALGPSKTIEGRVTDRVTGKPIEGVQVNGELSEAITDAEGRYRLEGVGKRSNYFVGAMPKGPYFPTRGNWIADSPGLEPVHVNFELDRGIEITGKLRDMATGKPISGVVWYTPKADNPALKSGVDVNNAFGRFESKPDGSFRILVLPGPGYLAVHAHENRFARTVIDEGDGNPIGAGQRLFIPQLYHTIAVIDPDEKKPASLEVVVDVNPGIAKKGVVVGLDGKPLDGALAFGITAVPDPGQQTLPRSERFGPPEKARLEKAEFMAIGLNPKDPRCLVFVHPEKKLGKIQEVRGDEEGDLTIKLEPLGSVTGRLVNADGSAAGGLTITPQPPRRFADYKRLPIGLLRTIGSRVGFDNDTRKWLPEPVKTDKDGNFQMDGFLAEFDYELWVSDGMLQGARTLHRVDVRVEPGKTKALGAVKLQGQ
jgi:RNA polymerase sigma factor (sigma-70 family)